MQVYVGYGFDATELSQKDWLRLMQEHDKETYDEFVEDMKGVEGESVLEETLLKNVEDWLADGDFLASYLRDIINKGEREAAGTDYIVDSYDNYLFFESIRFTGDSRRADYIRSESDFIQMIARYVSIDNITFGNLWNGSEFVDMDLWME